MAVGKKRRDIFVHAEKPARVCLDLAVAIMAFALKPYDRQYESRHLHNLFYSLIKPRAGAEQTIEPVRRSSGGLGALFKEGEQFGIDLVLQR